MAVIAVVGTLDTKGTEHAYLADCIRRRGHLPLLIDVGTGGPPQTRPDVAREEVAAAGGVDLAPVVARADRGECVAAMAAAAPKLLAKLYRDGRIQAAIALGGGGGTAIASAAMRALPLGVPKLIVSTLAVGNTAHYVGTSDLVLMPSIVDVAGLNRISRGVFRRAAAAVCGMVEADASAEPTGDAETRPLVVACMFGNTTACVGIAKEMLEQAGYEVLVFHATGSGGRLMEEVIASGQVAGVLDVTTTEWADELVGGVLSAGPHRLEAAARAGVPAVVAPGCLDMVNFGEPATVPERFAGRTFYAHNPQVTLLRTSVEESAELGRILAAKLNASTAPTSVLVPRLGLSVIGAPGGPFHDPAADRALFDALRAGLRDGFDYRELDHAINDRPFAETCARALLENMAKAERRESR